MIMISNMRRLWRYIYGDMTIWGILLFLPSILVIYPALFLLAIAEFILLDISWLLCEVHKEGWGRLEHNVWYLMH